MFPVPKLRRRLCKSTYFPSTSQDPTEMLSLSVPLDTGHLSSNDDSEVEIIGELKINLDKHQCGLCCKGNFLVSRLLRFGGILTEESKFICDVCDDSFRHKCDLTKHKEMHSHDEISENGTLSENPPSATPFICKYCSNTYKLEKNLYKHMSEKHKINSFHTCELCKKKFTSFRKFSKHCATHDHQVSSFHNCETCGKKFVWKSTLQRHVDMCHSAVS